MNKYAATTPVVALLMAAMLLACGGDKVAPLRGVEYFYGEGEKAFERKRYLDAIEHFRRVVSNFPGSPRVADAQYYLAESHFRLEDYVNASFEYQRLADAYPSSEWAARSKFPRRALPEPGQVREPWVRIALHVRLRPGRGPRSHRAVRGGASHGERRRPLRGPRVRSRHRH